MKKLLLLIVLIPFGMFGQDQILIDMNEHIKSQPGVEISYRLFKWEDGKEYVFMCLTLHFITPETELEKTDEYFRATRSSPIIARNVTMMNSFNNNRLMVRINNRESFFFDAIGIIPEGSRLYLKLNALFLIDDYKLLRQRGDDYITITVYSNYGRYGSIYARIPDVNLSDHIEYFDPEKFDRKVRLATHAWYQGYLRKQER